jgi:hypothetical protein
LAKKNFGERKKERKKERKNERKILNSKYSKYFGNKNIILNLAAFSKQVL